MKFRGLFKTAFHHFWHSNKRDYFSFHFDSNFQILISHLESKKVRFFFRGRASILLCLKGGSGKNACNTEKSPSAFVHPSFRRWSVVMRQFVRPSVRRRTSVCLSACVTTAVSLSFTFGEGKKKREEGKKHIMRTLHHRRQLAKVGKMSVSSVCGSSL